MEKPLVVPPGHPLVEPASPEELPAITELLDEAGLPHADLTPAALAHFVVAREGGALTGVAGLEVYGESGLLRSLAVAPAARGTGLGGRLVAAVEEGAQGLGLSALYLLTTTAAPFFAARGYAPTDRADVPAAVAASSEFTGLCPVSAACMEKRLR